MADTKASPNLDGETEQAEPATEPRTEAVEEELEEPLEERRELELVATLSKPISSDAPAGDHDPYDDAFESVKAEIGKISEVDYQMVVDQSTSLLQTKSKNLLVGSYLAVGLAHTEGLAGLEKGIAVQHAMATTFWEDGFPPMKRMAARQSAFQFLAEKTSEFFSGLRPRADDRPFIEGALENLKSLQDFTMERMGDKAPTLSGLKRVLEDIQRRIPKPAPPAAAAGADAGEPRGIQSESDARAAIIKAVSFFREKDATSATAFRVLRALRWGPILDEPPNEAQKTKLPAPLPARRAYFAKLNETGEHKQLVGEAEASFQEGTFHFWLDLQRMVAASMEVLGKEYDEARSAVLEETALLLRRMSTLPDLLFADGTPFADGLTVDWIESDVQPILSAEKASRAVPTSDAAGLKEDRKEADKALRKGDLSGAIKIMRKGSENDRSSKDRYFRQLSLADLCLKGNRPGVARPILEDLDKQIELHSLDVWEPDLALSAWSALHSCYKSARSKTPAAEKEVLERAIGDVFEKICRVDASFALTLPER